MTAEVNRASRTAWRYAGRPADDGPAPRGGLAGRDRGARPAGQARRGRPSASSTVGRDIAGLEQILRSPEDPRGLRRDLPRGPARPDAAARALRPPARLRHAATGWTRPSCGSAAGWCPWTPSFRSRTSGGCSRRPTRSGGRQSRRAFLPRRQEPRRRDRQEVHPARRGHLRLRPHVHPGGERLLRDHRQGRRRGRTRCATYALGRHVMPVSPNSLLRLPAGDRARPAGPPIEQDAREIQSPPGAPPGRRCDKFREPSTLGQAPDQCPEQVRRGGASALDGLEGKIEGIEARGDQPALPGVGDPQSAATRAACMRPRGRRRRVS